MSHNARRAKRGGRVEVQTDAGLVSWTSSGELQGSEEALARLRSPLPGQFGLIPDQVPFNQALTRKDTFLHLVATIWPGHRVLSDTVPDEKWSPDLIY